MPRCWLSSAASATPTTPIPAAVASSSPARSATSLPTPSIRWQRCGTPPASTSPSVLARLGITDGTLAITGGTGAFDLFLPHYDRFILSEVRSLTLPGGIPCFSKDHPRFVLPGAGLEARDMATIDPGVIQTTWVRATGQPRA